VSHFVKTERQEDLEDLESQQDLVVPLGKAREDPSNQVVRGAQRSQALLAALHTHEALHLLATQVVLVSQACLEKAQEGQEGQVAQLHRPNQKSREVQGCQVRQEALERPSGLLSCLDCQGNLEVPEGQVAQLLRWSGSCQRLETQDDQMLHQVAVQEGREVLQWCLECQEVLAIQEVLEECLGCQEVLEGLELQEAQVDLFFRQVHQEVREGLLQGSSSLPRRLSGSLLELRPSLPPSPQGGFPKL